MEDQETIPAVGEAAPDFTLEASVAGSYRSVSLSEFRGKTVVLAFYVMDWTGG